MTLSARVPLKLLLLSSGLGYTARGIETWMAELALHLPGEMHVELWSGGPAPSAKMRLTRCLHGLNRDARWLRRLPWHRRYLLEQLSILPQSVALLRWHQMDLVYCGDPVLSWHLKRFRPLHRAKVVFMNGMRLSANWAKDFDGVHLLAPPYLDAARRELAGKESVERLFAVPHLVDLERFAPPTPQLRDAARQRLALKEDDFVVLTVGPVGQVSHKRLEWLAQEVAAVDIRAILLSAGMEEDGAETVRAQAGKALGDRFRFLGRVERAAMPELFHAADVYALASLAEPFSIAILEALASGLPVVHHSDEVMQWQTGSGGVAVSMTEIGAAAKVLRRLKADFIWQRELGAAARKLAEDRYAPAHVSRQLVEALLKICGRDLIAET